MVTIQMALQGLIAAMHQDAYSIADQVVENVRRDGVELSLNDPVCRDAFVLEWLIARIAYLEVLAEDILDDEIRNTLQDAIRETVHQVSTIFNDVGSVFFDYISIAWNHH